MGWTNAEEAWKAVEPTLMDGLHLTYASCAIELQAEAINRLADVFEQVDAFWTEAVERKHEQDANNAFIIFHLIVGMSQYLWFWIHVKQDEMEGAWDNLVGAQEEMALAARLLPDPGWVRGVLSNLNALEIIAFPPQQFVSPGMIFDFALCSICGKVCGECDHLTGRLYMGRMCFKRPQNLSHFDHVAFVEYPEDKRCRMSLRGEKGRKVCTLTRRDKGEVPPPSDGKTVYGGESITLVATTPSSVTRANLTRVEGDEKAKYKQNPGTAPGDESEAHTPVSEKG